MSNYSLNNKNLIDFSVTINPHGVPNTVKQEMIASIEADSLFPDKMCLHLREEISSKFNMAMEHCICGSGVKKILINLMMAIKPKKALLIAPTINKYSHILNNAGCEVIYYYLSELNGFHLTAPFLDELDDTIDVLILGNPNDPTGQIISRKLMTDILLKCKKNNIFFVVDESHIDFVDKSEDYTLLPYVKGNKNLFLIRTLTNMFSLADLQLAFAFCSNLKLLDIMTNNLTTLDGISNIIQVGAKAALNDFEYVEKSKLYNKINKEYLLTNLAKLGFYIIGSQSNFIFLTNDTNRNIEGELLKKGIYIKNCSDINGLGNNHYKLAVKTKTENEKLILALINIII